MFSLDLSSFGVSEKLRPMVNDIIKVSTVAIVIEAINLNMAGSPFSLLLEQTFLNGLLFRTVGFMVYYMIINEMVYVKLLPENAGVEQMYVQENMTTEPYMNEGHYRMM